MVFWQDWKICFTIILQVKNEKLKIDFCSCNEIFINPSYCKLLLNQEYMLFVINMNFYV